MQTKHFGQLVALSALWGASFMLIRVASPVMGPNVLALLRVGAATVTLGILMRVVQHRWPVGHWRELKEDTLTVRKLVGCAFGFAGVALIVGLGPVEPSATVFIAAAGCVAASACYGISTPMMKRALTRMQPLEIAAGIHALSMLMLVPGAAWSWPQAHFTPAALGAVAVMGVVTSGLAYWVHIRILSHVTPVAAMSPIFMVPLFGVAWGHLFLGEELGTGMFAGGALVLVASALITGFNPWQKWLDYVDAKP